MTAVRKGQAPEPATREVFIQRYRKNFVDPAFQSEQPAIDRLAEIAWQAFAEGRKAPVTRRAGGEFADPDYELSVEWLATRDRLREAQQRWARPETRSRLLIVAGASRNDGTCPGEISKTWRLARQARETAETAGLEVDLLDLSLLTSEPGLRIFPCKGCVSTAMPLCHWPCSCYPNHALGQVGDWMDEIYERWVAAHGVLIVTPVYWYQSPSPLKLMIDRLVCADGGNPDPTRTHGKHPEEAKALEEAGWDYPQHLAGRVFGMVVHGDVAGIEGARRSLADWLGWMGLIAAGPSSQLDRFIGYYGPYASSHEALDEDQAVQQETRLAVQQVAEAVAELRAGRLKGEDASRRPRRK